MMMYFLRHGCGCAVDRMHAECVQLAAGLTLIGAFESIYHPVGIPMLVQNVPNPGAVIGVTALPVISVSQWRRCHRFLIKWIGWRAAFALPGSLHWVRHHFRAEMPRETEAPGSAGARRRSCCHRRCSYARYRNDRSGVTGSLLFNFTTTAIRSC